MAEEQKIAGSRPVQGESALATPSLYVNSVHLVVADDVTRITFGEVVNIEGQTPQAAARFSVTMTTPGAAEAAQIILKTIQDHLDKKKAGGQEKPNDGE
jgi:hypothetical protein